MRKRALYCIIVIGLVSLTIMQGCDKKVHEESVAEYKIAIPEPIMVTTNPEGDVALGDVSVHDVAIVVGAGSFDSAQTVSVHTPRSIPSNIDDQKLIGSPIEILAGETPVRLLNKTAVTFKFDKGLLPEKTDASMLRVAYYNGQQWDYIKPVAVDMNAGTMTFETYHFSLLAPKIADETKITEQFINSQSLDNVIRDGVNGVSDEVTDQIISMTLGKMGITDEKMQEKIFEKVAQAGTYKEIVDLYNSGDTVGASQKIAILAGEKIAETVPESVFKEALGNVIGAADDIAKVSEAAGYAAEGQYKQAAKIIGENIADKFLITTAGKIAVEAINGQIDNWKNSEVDAAYQAYKNGSSGYFWGYNVDKSDFDSVWDQMRGVRRQLEIEAIKKENAIRTDGGMPELSEREEALVRARVKESYQRQFETRSKNEEAIAKEKEQLIKIFDAFKKANLMDNVLGPQGLDKGYTYEQKLEVLNHFAKKMMKDTNRGEVSDKEGLIMETKISASDLAYGAKAYFSEPDGKKKYEEYIKERFGIDAFPKLSDLSGSWNGTITITEINISDAYRAKMESGENGEKGCDLAALEEIKGKPNPLTFELKPTSDTGGVFIQYDDGDKKSYPFTYNNGEIEVPISEDGADGKIYFTAKKSDTGFSLDGGLYASYAGGDVTVKGVAGAKR